MSLRSNSGVARVSAMWMIVVVVLFLAAIGFAFVASSGESAQRKDKLEAIEAQNAARALQEEQQKLKNAVSLVLGWTEEGAADPMSNLEDAAAGIQRLREVYTDISENDVNYESLIAKMISAYNARGSKIADLQGEIETLKSEVAVAQAAVSTVTSEKDDLNAGLRTELADEQQNSATRQQDLEDRLSQAQDQTAERDLELRQKVAEMNALQRAWDLDKQKYDARILELSRMAVFAKEPFSLYPDGKILEVSDQLPIAWINVGANQRLTRGTRFRVESGTPGTNRFKAWAEVIRVEANRAEVTLDGVVDRFDPVVAGDTIINPLYDPTGGRNAVLCGRFSGSFNERELTLLLERMGIVVQPALDLTTHFLIVGSELWADPETDEPLDEPIQASELPVFKDAEALGVQIIPLQDIREFFRVDSGVAGN